MTIWQPTRAAFRVSKYRTPRWNQVPTRETCNRIAREVLVVEATSLRVLALEDRVESLDRDGVTLFVRSGIRLRMAKPIWFSVVAEVVDWVADSLEKAEVVIAPMRLARIQAIDGYVLMPSRPGNSRLIAGKN